MTDTNATTENKEVNVDVVDEPQTDGSDEKEHVSKNVDPVTVSDSKIIDKMVEQANKQHEEDGEEIRTTTESVLEKQFLSFAGSSLKDLNELTKRYSKVEGGDPDKLRAWVKAYSMAIQNLLSSEDSYDRTVNRKNSQWDQKVNVDGTDIGMAALRFNETTKDDVISGRDAILAIGKSSEVGTPITVPLYHTGIWVTITPPDESDFLQLEAQLAREKIWLGRQTSGLVFSNTMVYTVEKVLNLVMKKIIDCSLENYTISKLKRLIKVTDLYPLVWALACAKYPRSYKYVRPCDAGPSKCTHLVEGDISLPKLFWTDHNALTISQKRHMSRRDDKFNEQQIRKYQDEHMYGGDKEIVMSDTMSVLLSVPSIEQYIKSGRNWIEDIVEMTEGSMSASSEDEKNEHIYKQGLISALRKYGHWVKEIRTNIGIVKDQETIDQLLNNFSGDENFVKLFEKSVAEYIDDSTISLIAIPTYTCPVCGTEQKEGNGEDRFAHLIPLDVINVFFTLQDQRIYKGLTNKTL